MNSNFLLASYNFHLPEAQIAQKPAVRREGSRLLRVDCQSGVITHGKFPDLGRLFSAGDVLVINDTKVFPARLLGHKETGGKVELLLLNYPVFASDRYRTAFSRVDGESDVSALLKSSKRPRPGSRLLFGSDLEAIVKEDNGNGSVLVSLKWQGDLDEALGKYGKIPLPPYIRRAAGPDDEDRQRYQTVYAKPNGAIAAPTAGLHFTDELLLDLQGRGVVIAPLTLHVGYGTFAPVRSRDIREHAIHSEWVDVSAASAAVINQSRLAGGRVWAIGTTSARALEFAADAAGVVRAVSGACKLYIYPGYKYRVVDNLVTNFHLPKSSLLFMVSAFASRDLVMSAYQEALERGYRFYSYGDAMVLIR
ncbi:MAG: tRNA preQ1(34) S-adenosylmethionine ribosyltransferase-isomerase QueA [Deltaproteobacteria bacterium]|nr:tRNA preQ1(34) S-adenosylmethionine ribosyltransferase-isomerase QueA [Deltaproteobacteria bacterium]